MKISFAATAVLLLFVFMLAAQSAPAQQMDAGQCIATSVTPGASQITIYVSQIIPVQGVRPASLSGAWGTYVKAQYHLDTISSAICQPFSSNPAIQERVLAAEENAWGKQGMNVVHVVWRPGQAASSNSGSGTSMYGTAAGPGGAAAAPPPPSAPPEPSGPEPRASYCYSDTAKPTIYFSDPFDTAGLPSDKAWSAAFSKMLAQKYSYKGTVTCKNTATIVSAQSAMLEQRDKLQDKQIVDTDWSYEPPPAPADSSAAPSTATPSH